MPSLSSSAHPPLDDFGLVPALDHLASTFREQTAMAVDFEAGSDVERLPPQTETALYRIVQEALTNVAKHAGATRVSILVVRRGDAVAAVIEDDGAGFDPASARDDALELAGMRERVALVDGRLRIESSPEGGTTIAVEVPL